MSAIAGDSPERHRLASRAGCGVPSGGEDVDGIRVKPEPEEDIKDFAETTMNELLGWYGYDKVSTGEARNLSLQALHHFSSSSSPPRGSPPDDDVSDDATDGEGSGGSRTPLLDVETVTQGSGNGTILCAWCLKNGLKLFTLKTASGQTKAFCSEMCFNQCRRAAFKKNRVCDWCKHVRHTVNYVDFQDGEHQLQFCSDKCLNQYKMNIFCKETQAYLQLHPHLQESGNKLGSGAGSSTNLITPDLWLRDCKEFANGSQGSLSNVSEDEGGTAGSNAGCCSSGGELEDLSVNAKAGQYSNSSRVVKESEKQQENTIQSHKEHVGTVSSVSKEDKGKQSSEPKSSVCYLSSDDGERHYQGRRKRHREIDKDSSRRTERRSSRLKVSFPPSHTDNRPPSLAHSSKLHYLTERGGLSSLSPSTSYPPPLINGSPPMLNRSTSSPNAAVPPPSSSIPVGLPPPPPLLNTELLHQHFLHSHLYPPPSLNLLAQQHQMEAFLRMQNALGMRQNMPQQIQQPPFPESILHPPSGMHSSQSLPNSMVPPATMMVPYPFVIPLPVPIPIPIPIPLSHFLNLKNLESSKSTPTNNSPKTCSADSQSKRVDSVITKLITKHQNDSSNRPEFESSSKSSRTQHRQKKANDNAIAASESSATVSSIELSKSPIEMQTSTSLSKDCDGELSNPMTSIRSRSKHRKESSSSKDGSKRQRIMDKYHL